MKTAAAKISLVLGSHAHVPYGADAAEFERTYAEVLRPFVCALYRYPRIQAACHYSGVLLNWIERTHQELFMLIDDMVARRQVEMLGGGFYDPILPIIPLQDKIGQVELLTYYIRRQFGKRPQGCWIPEYAWEQGLVSPLAACGMGFTFLAGRQFALAGASPDVPCICEDQGKLITVFPVCRELEAELAEKSVFALLEDAARVRLRDGADAREAVVCVFPDGAAVSGGGGAEERERAWSRFFEELSLCDAFVETVGPSRLHKRLKGLRKVYIPDSSGDGGAVPARRFIIEHPEAGRLYSKMVFSNVLVNQVRGDRSRKQSACEELWKAQGGVLFCRTGPRGVHGGELRGAAYGAMLGAERITREAGKFAPSLLPFDFDMDGESEWLFHDARLNCYVQPLGGGVFELDYLPRARNYLDTRGDRFAFADRLLPPETGAEGLGTGAVAGARLCAGERYEAAEVDKVRRKLCLVLQRPSGGRRQAQSAAAEPPFAFVEIEKCFHLRKDALCVRYSLANRGEGPADFCFSPEIDLSVPGTGEADARFFACRAGEADRPLSGPAFPSGSSPASGTALDSGGIKIHDLKNEAQITLSANRPCDWRIVPVAAEGAEGEGPAHQAFCLMPLFRVRLEAGKSWDAELVLKFSH